MKNMMRININKATTFLPLKKLNKASRTAEGRLNLAREMNDKFCDSVIKNMDDGKITLPAFVRLLKKATGAKIDIKGTRLPAGQGFVAHKLDNANTMSGYFFGLPFAFEEKFINMSTLKRALKYSQEVFTEITNPKIYARTASMENKGIDTSNVTKFFSQKVNVKGKLLKKDLQEFLKPMSLDEKIDNLQALRHSILHSQNYDKFSKHYMQKMNNNPKFNGKFGEDAINDNHFLYQEKLEMLNQELAKTLQKARAKN